MNDIASLNEQFALAGELGFALGEHGALVARIQNAHGRGEVAIQGAQVLSWTPEGQTPVVWLSPEARFAPGKSLRGGAPVCWPWFGAHPSDPSKPAHGFARTLDWRLLETASTAEGTRLVLGFTPGEVQQALWPHAAELSLTIVLGAHLHLELETLNKDHEAIELTQALHTYFQVGDIADVQVEGLDGCDYIDKVGPEARRRQQGEIRFAGEVNRIYLGCPGEVVIRDLALKRLIRITKQGSSSYVVWNPWAEQGARFGDMGEEGYRRMLCVETTNAASDKVRVAPGERCRLVTRYRVEAL